MRNMIYELVDTSKAEHLFEGWDETLIYSCLQKVMGKIYVTDLEAPWAAMAFVGCFGFYAGEPDEELVINKLNSVHLAEKLGYEFDHEYDAYEVN